MSDVFISHAHASSRRQARAAAEALRAAGYSVWLDDDLPAHRAFGPEIEAQLTAAKVALVIWSAEAATSHWVLSEANRAREANKLVQLTIDGARLPMPFDQIQCADLSGWSGHGNHPAWSKVAASVADLVRGSAGTSAVPVPVPAAIATPEPLLAVLAFDNLSGDPEMTYFSDGISEEILDTVTRGADLKVVGRASSFQFRGADKAAAKVASALKATHTLDGSVRRSGSQVRITARLVDCASETNLWSDRYDRDLTDIFALQDEIAAAVAATLKTLFARPGRPQSIDPAAYDLFLRARSLGPGSSLKRLMQQIGLFKQVVDLAPTFARGWASLAWASALTLRRRGADASRYGLTREEVVEAAETALKLDSGMGLAHQALGYLEPFGRYQAREALSSKALAAAPHDPEVLQSTAVWILAAVGRLREGLDFAHRAYVLDPLQLTVASAYSSILAGSGRYDEANAILESAIARWPDDVVLIHNLIASYARRGDWDRMDRLIEAALLRVPAKALANATRFARHLRNPDPDDLLLWLEEQRRVLSATGTVSLAELRALSVFGLTEEAFDLAERASYAHVFDPDGPPPTGNFVPGAIFSAINRRMIDDPRFVRLCAKLGLCDYWIDTDKWPDCANAVPYDFRSEARKVAVEGLARHV